MRRADAKRFFGYADRVRSTAQKHRARRRFRKNVADPVPATFLEFAADRAALGAKLFGGFLVHRVLARETEALLGDLAFFADTSVLGWKRALADLIVLGVTIPAAAVLVPDHSRILTGGAVVALFQDGLELAAKAFAPGALPYLDGVVGPSRALR